LAFASAISRAQIRPAFSFYRAPPKGLAPLADWMSRYGAFWRERLDDLERLLREEDQSPNPKKGNSQ
jgi:hypothetical protein